MLLSTLFILFFFFNDTATTEIYTLSLHDALPILALHLGAAAPMAAGFRAPPPGPLGPAGEDRKSTRLNSSHQIISYAVFCLKKKKYNIDEVSIGTPMHESWQTRPYSRSRTVGSAQ